MMDYNRAGQIVPGGMDALRASPNFGIYLLSAILKQQGYTVTLVDLVAAGNLDITSWTDAILDAAIIGLGSSSFAWPASVALIKMVRRIDPRVPIVVGGVHASLFDRHILRNFPVQFVIRGEGDVALPSLCRCLATKGDPAQVPNLSWVDSDGRIIRNPTAPVLAPQKLGRLPLPAFDQMPAGQYHYLPIESARGCPHRCSFCSTPFRGGWRAVTATCFIDRLARSMPFVPLFMDRQVQIVDDEFTIQPRRTFEIAQALADKGLTPKLRYCSRAGDVTADGFFDLATEFASNVFIGAECGYDAGLRRAQKGITTRQIEAAAERFHEHQIGSRLTLSFMIGLPWETIYEVKKTAVFAVALVHCYGVNVTINWYMQIPGSQLWNDFKRKQPGCETLFDRFGFSANPCLTPANFNLTPEAFREIDEWIEAAKLEAEAAFPGYDLITYTRAGGLARELPRENSLAESPEDRVSGRVERPPQPASF